MKGTGNGAPEQCILNLFSITRGEIPYDRLRGIDPTLIDRPASSNLRSKVLADVQWLVKTYEPRAQLTAAALEVQAAELGLFNLETEAILP